MKASSVRSESSERVPFSPYPFNPSILGKDEGRDVSKGNYSECEDWNENFREQSNLNERRAQYSFLSQLDDLKSFSEYNPEVMKPEFSYFKEHPAYFPFQATPLKLPLQSSLHFDSQHHVEMPPLPSSLRNASENLQISKFEDTLGIDSYPRITLAPPIFKFDQYASKECSVIYNPHKHLDSEQLSERIKNDFLESNESSLMHMSKPFRKNVDRNYFEAPVPLFSWRNSGDRKMEDDEKSMSISTS